MQTIGMLLLHSDSPRDLDAREELAAVLEGSEVGEPDELGVFEITVPDDDQEAALTRVWDAVAEAGVDDHVLFLEHPDLPEHWRARAGSPGA